MELQVFEWDLLKEICLKQCFSKLIYIQTWIQNIHKQPENWGELVGPLSKSKLKRLIKDIMRFFLSKKNPRHALLRNHALKEWELSFQSTHCVLTRPWPAEGRGSVEPVCLPELVSPDFLNMQQKQFSATASGIFEQKSVLEINRAF